MKKFKQILALILAFCMLYTVVPLSAYATNIEVNLDLTNKKKILIYFDEYFDTAPTIYDTNIINVTYEASRGVTTKANLSKNKDDYTGTEISIDDCLYTFESNNDGTFKVYNEKIINTDLYETQVTKKIYLSPSNGYVNSGDPGGYPGVDVEPSSKITLESVADSGTFNIKDSTHYIVFTKWLSYNSYPIGGTKPSSAVEPFSIYRKLATTESPVDNSTDTNASNDSIYELPGFVKITNESEIVSGNKYLIVSKFSGSYYALYPEVNNSDRNKHIAKIQIPKPYTRLHIEAKQIGTTSFEFANNTYNVTVTENQSPKQIIDVTLRVGETQMYTVQHSETGSLQVPESSIALINIIDPTRNDSTVSLGETETLSDSTDLLSSCLYTFDEVGRIENNTKTSRSFYIHSKTSDGTTVYLNINGAAADRPNNENSKVIEMTKTTQDAWNFQDTVGKGYLFNYSGRDLNNADLFTSNNTFNRVSALNEQTNPHCYFLLYRPIKDNEASDINGINGYKLISTWDQIISGERYLIVSHNMRSEDSGYYALHPAKSSETAYNHVAKLTSNDISVNDIKFTGENVGKETYTIGNTIFNVDIIPKDAIFIDGENNLLSKLTISNNTSFDLNIIDEFNNNTVVWKSLDESKVTIDEYGVITTKAPGNAQIVAVINNEKYTFDISIIETGYNGEGGKLNQMVVKEISNTTGWFSIISNKGDNYTYSEKDFIQLTPYEKIYMYFNNNQSVGMNFYARPDDGYALTMMKATGSAGDYYLLNKEIANNQHGSVRLGPGSTQKSYVQEKDLVSLLEIAAGMGCEGVFGFSSVQPSTNLSFRSQKLPTVTKEVVAIKHNNTDAFSEYIDGMNVEAGDSVVFKVSVENYESSETITYTNATLTEKIDTAYFDIVTKDQNGDYVSSSDSSNIIEKNITEDLNNDKKTSNGMNHNIHDYYVTYQVQVSDRNKPIINAVDFTYGYRSQYSDKEANSSSESFARITVVDHELALKSKDLNLGDSTDSIIVDFGLPVKLDYQKAMDKINNQNSGQNNRVLLSGNANYGDVVINQNIVTYTPNKVIEGIDIMTLFDNCGTEYAVPIYPASTVYYEEGFASSVNNYTPFEGGSKGTEHQDAEALGHKINNYGYDAAYEIMPETYSTAYQGDNAKTEFKFTGTGVDVYMNCTQETGKVTVMLKDIITNSFIKVMNVDTSTGIGDTTSTSMQGGEAFSLPVISFQDLPRKEYSLTISHIKSSGNIYLDGFKVYGTIVGSNYTSDEENQPFFTELRDLILSVQSISGTIIDELKASQIIHSQAFTNPNINVTGKVIMLDASSNDVLGDKDNIEDSEDNEVNEVTITPIRDLLVKGPKNELYLKPGQAVVFRVHSDTKVQLGLKAYNEEVNCTINGTVKNISSHTDLFYTVNIDSTNPGLVTIANNANSGGLLSITKVKLINLQEIVETYSTPTPEPNALIIEPRNFMDASYDEISSMFLDLESEDLIPALYALGLVKEEEVPDEPEIPDEPIVNPEENDNPIFNFIKLIRELIEQIRKLFTVIFGK